MARTGNGSAGLLYIEIKYALRAEGVTADTWDRDAAGYRLERD